MTARDFIAMLWRRWYLVLVFGAVAGTLALLPMMRPDVYWSRVTLVVLSPPEVGSNALTQQSPLALAALAVMDVNHSPTEVLSSRGEAVLLGLNVQQGTLVQVHYSGGQWAIQAQDPYIDVEATDHSPEAVQRRIEDAVAGIEAAMDARQDQFQVPQDQRARLEQSPPEPLVLIAPPSTTRAMGASLLAAAVAVGVAVTVADRLLLRRRARRLAARAEATDDDESYLSATR